MTQPHIIDNSKEINDLHFIDNKVYISISSWGLFEIGEWDEGKHYRHRIFK
jgi:hypothetical protein